MFNSFGEELVERFYEVKNSFETKGDLRLANENEERLRKKLSEVSEVNEEQIIQESELGNIIAYPLSDKTFAVEIYCQNLTGILTGKFQKIGSKNQLGFESIILADKTFNNRICADKSSKISLLEGIENMRPYCNSKFETLEPSKEHILENDIFPYVQFTTPFEIEDRVGENELIEHITFYELSISAGGVLTFQKYFKAKGIIPPSQKQKINTELTRSDTSCLINDLAVALTGEYKQ